MALAKQQQNIVVGVITIAFVLFAFFKWMIIPQNQRISSKRGQLKEVENKIEKLREKALQRDLLERQNEILKLELAQSEKQLPSKDEIANLLRYLTETSQISGINITNFNPSQKQKKQYYSELVFGIDMTATYHSLAQFLNTINQAERIISTRNVSIKSSGKQETGQSISATIQLVTYTLD